ncbi:hypothetical protein [Mycoplasmopsis verecunda]|uniref:Uncharacterized protein n=1 Tax=Mycoplasmopsis verecunda TaxID=171291 RepID=A0A1T4L8L1_9BACT|nr:hypothetical protein [Mycoplasmopsis verecunda]WPB54494.1 hypothetical protein SAM46_03365 [Mycoplasmopsis verecunda]SJZ51004.1 hypothetical protein SAMN02745154_00361 [Mycoplasmopsis verecunda]
MKNTRIDLLTGFTLVGNSFMPANTITYNKNIDINELNEDILYKNSDDKNLEHKLKEELGEDEYKKRKLIINNIIEQKEELKNAIPKNEKARLIINSIDKSEKIENNAYDLYEIRGMADKVKQLASQDITDSSLKDELEQLNTNKVINRIRSTQSHPKIILSARQNKSFYIPQWEYDKDDPEGIKYAKEAKKFKTQKEYEAELNKIVERVNEEQKLKEELERKRLEEFNKEMSEITVDIDLNSPTIDNDVKRAISNSFGYLVDSLEAHNEVMGDWLTKTNNMNIVSASFTAIAWGLFAAFSVASFFTFNAFAAHAASALLQASFMTYFTKRSFDSYYEGAKRLSEFQEVINSKEFKLWKEIKYTKHYELRQWIYTMKKIMSENNINFDDILKFDSFINTALDSLVNQQKGFSLGFSYFASGKSFTKWIHQLISKLSVKLSEKIPTIAPLLTASLSPDILSSTSNLLFKWKDLISRNYFGTLNKKLAQLEKLINVKKTILTKASALVPIMAILNIADFCLTIVSILHDIKLNTNLINMAQKIRQKYGFKDLLWNQ